MKKPKPENRKEKEGKENKQEMKMEKMMGMAEYKKSMSGKKTNYKGKCC